MSIEPEDTGKEVSIRDINTSLKPIIVKRTVQMVITGPKGKLVLYENPFPYNSRYYKPAERDKSRAIKAFMEGSKK